MKTAATLDVTVPESRELRVVLPPEVPPGQARLVVMVEERDAGDRDFDEVELVDKDGVLVVRSKVPREFPLEAFDHRRSREERIRKLSGV
jgi:hypothetical protein